MQKFPSEWSIIDKVNFLQRKIILNCIAYYELDTNKLTDREYDELSKQLVELQKDIDISQTQYGYLMYDFDGTTGFDLYSRLNDKDKEFLTRIAINTLRIRKRNNKNKKN